MASLERLHFLLILHVSWGNVQIKLDSRDRNKTETKFHVSVFAFCTSVFLASKMHRMHRSVPWKHTLSCEMADCLCMCLTYIISFKIREEHVQQLCHIFLPLSRHIDFVEFQRLQIYYELDRLLSPGRRFNKNQNRYIFTVCNTTYSAFYTAT